MRTTALEKVIYYQTSSSLTQGIRRSRRGNFSPTKNIAALVSSTATPLTPIWGLMRFVAS